MTWGRTSSLWRVWRSLLRRLKQVNICWSGFFLMWSQCKCLSHMSWSCVHIWPAVVSYCFHLSSLVLRRVKVTFLNTVFKIEHVPENSKTGIVLEIRIKRYNVVLKQNCVCWICFKQVTTDVQSNCSSSMLLTDLRFEYFSRAKSFHVVSLSLRSGKN